MCGRGGRGEGSYVEEGDELYHWSQPGLQAVQDEGY